MRASAVLAPCVVGAGLFFGAMQAAAETTFSELMEVAELSDIEARIAAQDPLVPQPDESIEPLLDALDAPDATQSVRLLVIFLLGESGRADACARLQEVDAGEGDHAAYVHASALASCGQPEAIRAIVRDTARPVPVRLKAAVAAGLREDRALLGDVRGWLDDSAFEGFHTFVYLVMGLLGDESVAEVLAELLSQRATRDHAAIALARAGDTGRLFELQFALENPDPMVRRAALRVASGQAYSAIHSAARRLVDDPNASVAGLARLLFAEQLNPAQRGGLSLP